MTAIEGLKDRIFKGKDQGSIEDTICVIMRDFGYTFQELFGEEIEEKHEIKILGKTIFRWNKTIKKDGLPYPTFQYMVKFLQKDAERQNRQMKGIKKR